MMGDEADETASEDVGGGAEGSVAPAGPYAAVAWQYRRAGWDGVVPLPVRAKKPVPSGWTGGEGAWPSGGDVQAWIDGPQGAGNVALRLPGDVVGIDVDAYPGKSGGATLAEAEARYGALPETWRSGSREDAVSGIRLYRIPAGTVFKGQPWGRNGGIEMIQRHHRYAVVWPSIHPETGREYVWLAPDGGRGIGVPRPADLPELPAAWAEGLAVGGAGDVDPFGDVAEPGAAASALASGDEPFAAPVRAFTVGEARRVIGERLAAFRAMRTPDDHGFNDALNELAVVYGHAVPAFTTAAGAARAMFDAATVNRSVEFQGREGVMATIRSGLRKGMATPWERVEEVDLTPGAGEFVAPANENQQAESSAASSEPVADQMTVPAAVAVVPDRNAPLDWPTVWAADHAAVQWLPGRLAERGQQVALVGAGKAGKSLVVLDWARCAVGGLPFLGDEARRPLRVAYADRENSQRDIYTRLVALGAQGPEDVAGLVYFSFPAWAPLDTSAGAAEFLSAIAAEHKREPIDLVILDTASRYIEGDENDSSPWLALYRLVQSKLKAAGIAGWRLDHFGKDDTRGARGSVAKAQDVDHVWELRVAGVSESPGGPDAGPVVTTALELVRTHTRSGLGAERIEFTRVGRYADDEREAWLPGGTAHEVPGPFAAPVLAYDPAADEALVGEATAALVGLFRRTFAKGDGGTKAEVRSLAVRSETNATGSMSRATFFRAWGELIERRVIARVKGKASYRWVPVEDRDDLVEQDDNGEYVTD